MIYNVYWVNPSKKKPEKNGYYPITVEGLFVNRISAALWYNNHWWRGGEVIDKDVISWAKGLEPFTFVRKKRRHRRK